MTKRLITLCLCLSVCACISSAALGLTPAEETARRTVLAEIHRILVGTSPEVSALGRFSPYARDFQNLLRRFHEVATPKTVMLEGKPGKILVPLRLDKGLIGGFFQLSPDGRTILSTLPWGPDGIPLFRLAEQDWLAAPAANDLPGIAELIPGTWKPTAGVPVAISDLTDVVLIEHLDAIPSKTQEEKRDYALRMGFQAPEKRRYGSLKCLAYAASYVADWWKVVLGLPIGSYVSFMTGGQEYGTDPRMLEALYFATPKSPYSLLKYNIKKDLVTSEKVPYSPKHYAYVLSSITLPATVPDPLTKKLLTVPDRDLGMDRPFFTVFNNSRGTVESVRQAIESYGMLLGQHTMRMPGDKRPISLIGIHSITLVGTAKLKGQDVVLYWETFGRNHRDYVEDGFYGPSLRAFPVGFFFQGMAFPHPLHLKAEAKSETFQGAFVTGKGQMLAPDRLTATLDGKPIAVKSGPRISVPVPAGVHILRITYRKRYFQTPEEPETCARTFVISGDRLVELGGVEAVGLALTAAKQHLAFWKKERDGYRDFLQSYQEKLRIALLERLKSSRTDGPFLKTVHDLVKASPILEKAVGRELITLRAQP